MLRKAVSNVYSAGQQHATRLVSQGRKAAGWQLSVPPAKRRYSEAFVEQDIAVGSQLREHSDPETAAKLVIHTAVAYSQLRGLNEFAFDTDATSTCAVSGVCMGKLCFTRPLCGWASCVCIADRDGVIYWHHSDTRH